MSHKTMDLPYWMKDFNLMSFNVAVDELIYIAMKPAYKMYYSKVESLVQQAEKDFNTENIKGLQTYMGVFNRNDENGQYTWERILKVPLHWHDNELLALDKEKRELNKYSKLVQMYLTKRYNPVMEKFRNNLSEYIVQQQETLRHYPRTTEYKPDSKIIEDFFNYCEGLRYVI